MGQKNVDLQTTLNVSGYIQFVFNFQKGFVKIKQNQSNKSPTPPSNCFEKYFADFHGHIFKAELDVEPKIHICRCV